MSEPVPDDALTPEPDALHTDAELAALAAVMPSVPDTLETADTASSWLREVIDPSELSTEEPEEPDEASTAGASISQATGQAAGTTAALRSAVVSAIRNGGTVTRPSTGQSVRWTPIEAVADEYDASQSMASKGYSCLGVIGNASHLRGSGGHTPWCSEGYAGISCKFGKVYAIDLEAPDMTGLERWLIPRLRAGSYKWVYYLNINGHQYTRKDSFRGTYSSADQHLHLSGLAGHESDNSSILRDYQNYRTNGGEDMAQVPQAQWDRVRKQLDSIDDVVHGGKGSAYRESVMKRDHQSQVEQLKAYVDERLDAIETKLDALLTATTTPTA